MKRTRAVADRIFAFSLSVVAAVNLLFVLFFVAVLVFVTGRARAEEIACKGKDLVAELSERDPDLLRQMRDEASAAINGEGLLWRVEGQGRPPSFLFGTMHVTDPRVVALPTPAQDAFAKAQTIVIETTDVLDKQAMMAAMVETPELMMFPAGESLTDHLTAQETETISAALAARGVLLDSVVKMKPWMLVSLTSLPACEMKRQEAGALVLDVKLAADAQANGKRLTGLESAGEQLAAMASLPMDVHVQGLISTLGLGERMDDMIETMIGLYERGETGMFWPALNGLLMREGEDTASYGAFEEAMVTMRNKVMAERAALLLDEGGAFIAVGAMHLPGEAGLIALLRQAGYKISRAD